MAQGDSRGRSIGQKAAEAFDEAIEQEAQLAVGASNIVVGEFLSELQSAIRFRMKLGQTQGDWVEEPERFYTDGCVFAEEVAVASQVKLQITVSLDASASMWNNRIMNVAGPTFAALDQIIRASMRDLPEGTVHYAPFVFHEKAFKIPSTFIPRYTGGAKYAKRGDGVEEYHPILPNFARHEEWDEAVRLGEVPADAKRAEYKLHDKVVSRYNRRTGKTTTSVRKTLGWTSDYRLSGNDTLIAPLMSAISKWEDAEGDTNATRLDIIITDGKYESAADIERASQIQEMRNGRLRTVLLNFLPMSEWENIQLPARMGQFAVTPGNLDTGIRTILADAINDIFA